MSFFEFEKLTHQDANMICLIVDRAKRESNGTHSTIDKADTLELQMDIGAYHLAHGLRLDDLWNAPIFDLLHDVHGIHCHLNRDTGKLEDHFLPRYSTQPTVKKCPTCGKEQ